MNPETEFFKLYFQKQGGHFNGPILLLLLLALLLALLLVLLKLLLLVLCSEFLLAFIVGVV